MDTHGPSERLRRPRLTRGKPPHAARGAIGPEPARALRAALVREGGSMSFERAARALVARHGVPAGMVLAVVTGQGLRVVDGEVRLAWPGA